MVQDKWRSDYSIPKLSCTENTLVIEALEKDQKCDKHEAFAYGSWKVDQIMKDGSKREERGHWSTHNVKVGNNWKMTIDHTNDAEFYKIRNTP